MIRILRLFRLFAAIPAFDGLPGDVFARGM
jgi:hypothetical protein